MKILMLSSTFPYPPMRGGTQVRTFHLLKYLSDRHSVTLATQPSEAVTATEIEELRHLVAELAVFPRPAPAPLGKGKLGRFRRFLCEGTPPNVLSAYSPAMQHWIDESLEAGKYEVVTCEHSVNEIYVRSQRPKGVRAVVNVHSSVSGTCQQVLAAGTSENKVRDRLYLPLLRRYEQRYCSKFSRIVVTTDQDRQQLQALLSPSGRETGEGRTHLPPPISVVANGVDLAEFPYRQTDPGGHRLIFAGAMDNLPNIDAARFLSLEVLPRLQQRYPEASLALVGANPGPELRALGARPGIEVLGRVPRVVEYLHQATVCVVPMRIGLGIKNKTLEAMAAGTPVVASDRGLEGLAVDGGGHPLRALRANLIQEYVEAIGRLFASDRLRQELSGNGRSLIESEYTWDVQGTRYENALQRE